MSADVVGEISNNLKTLELKISKKTKKVKIPDTPEFQDDMLIGKKYKFKGAICIWDGDNGWLCPDKLKYKDCKEERCIKKYKFLRFVLRFIPLIVIFCCELCEKRFGNNKEGEDIKLYNDVWEDGEDACKECREARLKDIKCNGNNKVLCENHDKCRKCYNKSFMSHEKAKYWSLENNLTPRQVTKHCHEKFWFKCETCDHNFELGLDHISGKQKQWCSYCAGKKLCSNECNICFYKSFASSDKNKCWSNKNKNKEGILINPRDIFLNCNSKFWFNCDKCPHDFYKSPNDVVSYWCPYCTNKILCENDDCEFCFNKSFDSNDKKRFWSDKNKDENNIFIRPRDIFKCSNNKYWFNCYNCFHTFDSTLDSISGNNTWCPYCASKILCQDNKCKFCRDKSFASYDKSQYWSIKNKLNPRDVFKYSHSKFLFDCDICNKEFKSRIDDVSNGSWCPFCKCKTEKLILEFLSSFNPKHQYKVDWCKNRETNKYLPFDIFIFVTINDIIYNIIIEVDGRQHFMNIDCWNSNAEDNLDRDIYKMKQALDNNHYIIRICQDDVWNSKINWKILLLACINKYPKEQIEYIAKDTNLYNNHQKKIYSNL
jgi:hypothetical protein